MSELSNTYELLVQYTVVPGSLIVWLSSPAFLFISCLVRGTDM